MSEQGRSSSDHPRPRLPHILAAVLGPLLVLALVLGPVLMRGDAEKSEDALAVEQALQDVQPQIVLLGASTMNESVDVEIFEQALGDEAVSTAKLVKASTMPAVWYVLAKERLFGAGLAPRVLVVGSTPKWLMHTAVSTVSARTVMANHMLEYHPVVARKAYGKEGRSVLHERLDRWRVNARAGFQDRVREVTVGLLHGDGDGSLLDQGARAAEPALDRVFSGEGAVDLSLHSRVIPVVEMQERADAPSEGVAASVLDSFVPDLIELAHEHDTRIVFVWLPYPDASEPIQEIEPAQYAELVRALNDAGAGWLDLHGLDYPDQYFRDRSHMNAKGRQRFSKELAQALLELGALGEGPLPRAVEPFFLGSQVRLEGEPRAPAMPELQPHKQKPGVLFGTMADQVGWSNRGTTVAGLGATSPLVVLEDGEPLQRGPCGAPEPVTGSFCHISGVLLVTPREPGYLEAPAGHYRLALERELPIQQGSVELWWAYPGTSLVADVEGGAGGAPLRVELSLEAMGPGAPPTVTVASLPVSLEQRAEVLVGSVELPQPTEPWSVRVEAPPQGAMVAVRRLAVVRDEQTLDLMGSQALVEQPTVDLLFQAKKGRMEIESSFEPWVLQAPQPHPNGILGRIQAPRLAGLSNEQLVARTHCPRCSPLRLIEGEAAYGPPLLHCGQLRAQAAKGDPTGNFCQQGEEIQLASTDGSPSWEGGKVYRADIVADRLAGFGTWLAPGDRATIPVAGWQSLPMRHGIGRLVLEGVSVPVGEGSDSPIAVTLLLGDEPSHRLELQPSALDAGTLVLPLEPPLEGAIGKLAVRFDAPATAPLVMLSRAELEE